MTGHHAERRSHGANPLRVETPGLNAQAARLATARLEGDPLVRDLQQIEPKFIAELLRRLDGADHPTIGAVLMAAGQLASQVLDLIDPAQQRNGGPILANLLQLAGQQLYHGKMRHIAPCPYPLATGNPCSHVGRAETEQQLDAVMRGHVALHHPGEAWPVDEPVAETYEAGPAVAPVPDGWRDIADEVELPYTSQHGHQYERDQIAPTEEG